MDRRTFPAGTGAILLAAPLAAEAQPATTILRIGYLATDLAGNPHGRETFVQGLRDLGYVEGRNVVIEYRFAEGKPERLPALAAELVALKVDVPRAADGDGRGSEHHQRITDGPPARAGRRGQEHSALL